MKKILVLSYNDLTNIIREPMLIMLLIGPVLFTFMVGYILPYLSKLILPFMDLTPYYSLISAYVVLFVPLLMGMIIGFLLLDEKDDNTWMTVVVTPIGKKGYLYYRIIMPTLISFLYVLVLSKLGSLVNIEFIYLIPIALLSGLEAPIIALFLLLFADNKVEGLVLSKSLGLLLIAPLIQYFTESKLALLAGIIPLYWPVQAFLLVNNDTLGYWMSILIGLLLHLTLLGFLIRKFDKRIG